MFYVPFCIHNIQIDSEYTCVKEHYKTLGDRVQEEGGEKFENQNIREWVYIIKIAVYMKGYAEKVLYEAWGFGYNRAIRCRL